MNEPASNLYIAVLVYSTVVDGAYRRPRFSEDVVPIMASSEDEARAVAVRIGRNEQTSYLNECGETVRWSFLGVADLGVALTDTLEPGVSLSSRSFEDLDRYRELYSIASLSDELTI